MLSSSSSKREVMQSAMACAMHAGEGFGYRRRGAWDNRKLEEEKPELLFFK
jgi:hypothetical protein